LTIGLRLLKDSK